MMGPAGISWTHHASCNTQLQCARKPGSGHHNRNGVLLSNGMESLSLDKDVVSDFAAW